MHLTLHIPETLASKLNISRSELERVALAALTQAADQVAGGQQAGSAEVRGRTPAKAAARMLAARAGNFLPDGVSIRDLLSHGHA